jgi:hypothetical protein
LSKKMLLKSINLITTLPKTGSDVLAFRGIALLNGVGLVRQKYLVK